ncbi:MAG: aldolase/citrate lyase family protein [Planctomycetota bacterium]
MKTTAATSPLHKRLVDGPLIGPFCKTSDPSMIEAMARGGMDFVILDLEHGPNDIVNLGPLIRAAEAGGAHAVVRTGTPDQVGRALDLGAAAVQVPHVSDAASAQAIVQAARFAPDGQRGVCRYVRAAGFGTTDKRRYFVEANRATVIAQVEGEAGINNLNAILAVAGVDVVFVGVYDLSQSLGVTGQTDHPHVEAALHDVVERCKSAGRPVGTFVESVEDARRYRGMGVHYLCYSVDVGLIANACCSVVEACRDDGRFPDAASV